MKIPLREISHLEIFILDSEKFIKDDHESTRGNATRWPGKRDYVFIEPETLVQRKGPDILEPKI